MTRSFRNYLIVGFSLLIGCSFAGSGMTVLHAQPASSAQEISLEDEDDNGYSSSTAETERSSSEAGAKGLSSSEAAASSQGTNALVSDPASHRSGMVYTGNKNIDYLAEVMVQAAGVKENMDDDTKVKLIYHYITVNFHHIHSGEPFKIYYDLDALKKEIKSFRAQTAKRANAGEISYTDKYSGMLKYMLKRGGECNAQAGVFAVLLNHVGVECGVCHGRYLNRNGTAPNHYWNYAVVDGRTYYYDVDVELQNYGKGQGDYYWYKKTRAEAEETHAF